MELTPLHRRCSDSRGGIRSISLARASDLGNTVFDHAARCWSISSPAALFVPVELPEDSARYGEKAVRESGALKVEHTLAFLLDPVGGAAANFISSLEEWSRHSGMVAIVELLSGERLLVGFSRRFLARMPLRLSAVEGSTGGKPSERSALTVTLRSTDTAPALPLL